MTDTSKVYTVLTRTHMTITTGNVLLKLRKYILNSVLS